ncbi:SDR family NAD(P)-dependent oxidoreductase [Xanthobacteraceae bacterium Astr-EGSB]|uniref:SDR family NAD(P)-dependent oxidoreductase n=1 Tax=Astrobacterium formosum TaxID=3069710 RepID=UPI0027B0F10D|nr:SDR family NAD(P)-dependent oxidoreductase [Xanthobacteraceae bacterium Astr-EGSB]
MEKVILITGASSGFGRLTANALAAGRHTVYASMRGLNGRNAAQMGKLAAYAESHKVDLRALELDVQSEESARSAGVFATPPWTICTSGTVMSARMARRSTTCTSCA